MSAFRPPSSPPAGGPPTPAPPAPPAPPLPPRGSTARVPGSEARGKAPPRRLLWGALACSLFLSGFCGILAELSLFNLAETLLGGTNENLTYTMGFMMFAMGLGAALTGHRRFPAAAVELLIAVELAISLLAMGSVVGIYALAGWLPGSAPWLIWSFSPLLGLVIGLEIPVVLRLNETLGLRLQPNAALALAPDYFGALAAFVLFPFWLLPALGLARAAWLGGLLNLLVAGGVLLAFSTWLRRPAGVWGAWLATALLALLLGWELPGLMAGAEQLHYRDGIVAREETPYQRVVITARSRPGNPTWEPPPAGTVRTLARAGALELREQLPAHPSRCSGDVRLFINGGLQFSTCDEYRYHEMLVHPAAFLAGLGQGQGEGQGDAHRALVLGGGDGLAVRELLKYPRVTVELVELDPAMVRLFRDDPRFARLNGGALSDPRVQIRIGDAYAFLREASRRYNLIVLDFPDPHQTATARLYSLQLFRFAARALTPAGVLATQSFSPLYQQAAFAVVRKTLAAAGFRVVSLQVPMLTFEHWGFQVASRSLTEDGMKARLEGFRASVPTRYLNREAVQAAWRWDKEAWRGSETLPVNDQFTLPLLSLYTRGRTAP
jgi:spermidine synthase